jgi:hypothetical protein
LGLVIDPGAFVGRLGVAVVWGEEGGGADGLGVAVGAVGDVLGALVSLGESVGVGVGPGDGVLLGAGVVLGVGGVVGAGALVEGLLGAGDGDGDGDGDGVGVGDGDGEGDGARTVSVVAHGWVSVQVSPCGAAVVTSSAPPGASAATAAWNDAVATALEPPCPANAGRVQVSSLSDVPRVRPSWASSLGGVVMLALSRRRDRSSTTVAPAGSGCPLSTCSLYVIVVPGAMLPPDDGLADTVTVSGGCVLADELGTNGSSQAPTARIAGTTSHAPLRAGRRGPLRWKKVDPAGSDISALPPRRQLEEPAGTGTHGLAGQ